MEKLKVVIIDDEPDAIKSLVLICHEHCDFVEIVGDADNIEEGYLIIKERLPDVVMLDIDLPWGNGFELLSRFPKKNFHVVLVSGYFLEYEKQIKKYGIKDLVTKPIDIEKLKKIMEHISENKLKTD
jgi:YesN/AraC family two-component response regulator